MKSVKPILIGIGAVSLLFLFRKKITNAMTNAINYFNTYRGITETDKRFYDFLYKIWRHVGYSDSWAKKAIQDRIAWSAAFISYVYKDYTDFPKSASHSHYIVASRENTQLGKGNFRLRKINEYKPKIGDLVCINRGGKNYTYDSIFKGAISHCDTVVKVNPTSIETIGGNVSNQISKTIVPTKNGYINKSGYFAIIQNISP